MYQKFMYSIFIISICFNIYYGFNYYEGVQSKRYLETLIENSKIKDISLKEGKKNLFQKIKKTHPEYEKIKKYYFISIWNTVCRPYIKEIPLLNSLANNVYRKDVGYLFITENGEKMITHFQEKHRISLRNFNFINDTDIYTSSILKNHCMKNRQYPIQLITDNKGDVKYFQVSTIENSNNSLVMNCIKNLKK